MDVRMPDGTIIRGIPDGTPKDEIMRRYQRMQAPKVAAKPDRYDPTEGMSGLEKFAAGAVGGVVDAGRGVGQLLGLASTEDVDEAKRLMRPLNETGAGLGGNITGQIAASLVPGGALGIAGKAAQIPAMTKAAMALLAPKTIKGAAALGTGMGATQQVGSDDSRWGQALLGGAGGAVGGALGAGVGRILKPRGATPGPDDAIRREAEQMGFELTPGQRTGKRWQQTLDSVFAQMPGTSGRMDRIRQGQQTRVDDLVDAALARAGGAIDQPSAQSAAMEGFESGVQSELSRTGAAYQDLLRNVDVPTGPMRQGMTDILANQSRLPADQQGGSAITSLKGMLGDPGYAKKAKTYIPPTVDESKDDVITAIRKLGGITPTDEAVGSLAKGNPFPNDPRLGPVWRTANAGQTQAAQRRVGHSLDEMAQHLYQKGYIPERDPNLVMDAIAESSMGRPQFSAFRDQAAAREDPLADALNQLTSQLRSDKAPPAPQAGWLRDNPSIAGETAQDLRSAYGAQAEGAYAAGKNEAGHVWRGMRETVDDAIDKALPEAKRGQFKAINERYGMDMAVKAMTPKSQEAFINQLYRGAPDQLYTFMGIAPDSHFTQVARGYLSKLVEKSEGKAGGTSAAALGRNIRKQNPEALRVLGGESGQMLAKLGRVGEVVLPDATGNSGTAQRALFQSLLMGGTGGLIGGGYGAEQGGGVGAVAGGLLGALALPKAAQTAYLSKAAKPFLEGTYQGVKKLPKETEELLRRLGMFGGIGAAGLLNN